MLGTIVALVQVLVFCLLTSIYISLATEHDEVDTAAEAHAHCRGRRRTDYLRKSYA